MSETAVVLGDVHHEKGAGGREIVVDHCSPGLWAWRAVDSDGRWAASGCSYLSAEKALSSARKAASRLGWVPWRTR